MRAIIAISDLASLLHEAVLRDIHRAHKSTVAAILIEMAQMAALLGGFLLLAEVMSFGGTPIRGDMMLYLVTGIFFYQVHSRTVTAVMRTEGAGSMIMHHLPLRQSILVAAAALSSLYLQVVAAVIVLLIYHLAWAPIGIETPLGFMLVFFLAWVFGVAVGMTGLAIKPTFPSVASVLSQFYNRANMLASGQMFVANALPSAWLVWFDWNPLFHLIDQARGFTFENYDPWFSQLGYPVIVILVLLILGIVMLAKNNRVNIHT